MKSAIYYSLLALIVLTGCNSKDSQEQEVEKLLDRQAVLKEKQEESVDRIREIQDSLMLEKKKLLDERDRKDHKVEKLQENQQVLVDRLNSNEQSAVASEKQKLEQQISAYEDSIRNFKGLLNTLGTNIDSLEQSMKFYGIQEGQAEQTMLTGISEIDERISKLEDRKAEYAERADLIIKRVSIYQKKIEAFNMERTLYLDEKDKLLRQNASDDQLAPYLNKISSLDSVLKEQKSNQELLRDELAQINRWISEIDEMIDGLQTKVRNQHEQSEIVESYIESEKQRLENKLAELKLSRENLVNEQDLISQERSRLEREISSLDRKMELIRSREMSDILELQADIQQSDASLAEEEIRNIQTGPESQPGLEIRENEAKTTDIPSGEELALGEYDELNNINAISQQLDSLQKSIEQERTEILKTRMELAERRAELARKRATFGRAMGTVILIGVVGGLALLSLFYFLGKRARTTGHKE